VLACNAKAVLGLGSKKMNGRSAMTTVVATHAVGNMDTWLRGGDNRKALFAEFCSGYRIFKHADANRVSVIFENVDLAKMKATFGSAVAAKAKAANTVIDPVDIYIEVAGGK
jgi:hypothetical protein